MERRNATVTLNTSGRSKDRKLFELERHGLTLGAKLAWLGTA